MQIRKTVAIVLGKLILHAVRLFKIGGGSAAPGLYALKIYPNLVSDLASQIPQSVVITGTNGKTTTARMLAHFAQNHGLKVIRNATGSNLERGLASSLISAVNPLNGKLKKFDLAIWELDEAAFNQVVNKINPQTIVFLNVFRDQLDRYGEIDTIVKKWAEKLQNLPAQTNVFINGDDQNLNSLKKSFKGKIQTFGVKDFGIEGEKVIHEEKKEPVNFEALNVKTLGLDQTSFIVSSGQDKLKVELPLPGIYHIYDFLAAFACSKTLNLAEDLLVESLKNFSPAFGRVEKIYLSKDKKQKGYISSEAKNSSFAYIFLIKNPAGATQVFQTIKDQFGEEDRLFIALNDNFADGTDVSWIWDAQFEQLVSSFTPKKIYISGSRARDLALRLKYAGFNYKNLQVNNIITDSLEEARKGLNGCLFILPTYTALLELQKILANLGIKEHYWKEDK